MYFIFRRWHQEQGEQMKKDESDESLDLEELFGSPDSK